MELNDIAELDRMALSLETCARHGVRSLAECDARIAAIEARMAGGGSDAERASLEALKQARAFAADKGLLPQRAKAVPGSHAGDAARGDGRGHVADEAGSKRREARRDARGRETER